MRFVLGAFLLAIVVSLLLPVQYEAKTVLLPPAQNSSIGSALMGQLGNLGSLDRCVTGWGGLGLKNPADMYVSLLTSRTVEDAMIQRFGLMKEYHEKRMSDTRNEFERRTNGCCRAQGRPDPPLGRGPRSEAGCRAGQRLRGRIPKTLRLAGDHRGCAAPAVL